jgi:hypothetical protein
MNLSVIYWPINFISQRYTGGKVIDGYNALDIDEGEPFLAKKEFYFLRNTGAGMSDLIGIDDVYFDVLDHKTNKCLISCPYDETLYKPFDHLQACQWSIYACSWCLCLHVN